MSFFFSRPRIPKNTMLFAVGDIHGCADILQKLHDKILAYSQGAYDYQKTIVYLGDYIDRGPDSKGVIDMLLSNAMPGFNKIFLKGNHEQMLLDFLSQAGIGQAWLDYTNGGRATLQSYGILEPKYFTDLEETQAAFLKALPEGHLSFFQNLQMHYESGDYYFAHAGVHPNRPLSEQMDQDLLWIREPFLSSANDYGKIIVHGHTIVAKPDFKPNRIGIDTGAYWSGTLTALVLHDDRHEFMQVSK